MSLIRRVLVLQGAYAGQTKMLAGVQFTNGRAVIQGEPSNVDGLSTYLRKCYQAVPEEELPPQVDTPPEEDPNQDPPPDGLTPAEVAKLEDALLSLSPDNDEHWTEDGLPRVDVVVELSGVQVRRADIEALAPDLRRG